MEEDPQDMGDIAGTIDTTNVWEVARQIDGEPIDDRVLVSSTNHELLGGTTPAVTNDGAVRVWILGEVYGFADPDAEGGYAPRPSDLDSATYCANLYEVHGPSFVQGVNGNYACVVYDQSRQAMFLYTDRLATVTVYFGRPDADSLVFSSNLQDLPRHPWIETTFDPAYLCEYFAFKRVYGVKTPLSGIEELRPGTVYRFGLSTGCLTTESYWQPRFRPRNVPIDRFVDRFVRTFSRVIDEWVREDLDYGVLLSGDSDSRLVMHGLGPAATAFHMADWMNREARIAERAAMAAGNDFVFLRRSDGYRIEALERNSEHVSFNGWFTQPYTSGFEDEIRDRVDVLVSGMYSDTLFKDHTVPSPSVSLGSLGIVTLPVASRISTVDEYVDHLLENARDREFPIDLRSVLEENVYREDGRIVHHGVSYSSIDELVYYDTCYPLSNDDDAVWSAGLRRSIPYRTPYLDNRFIDLSLMLPIRHRVRDNVVDRALERLSPELARIPHATTGVPLTYTFPVEYIAHQAIAFLRKHVAREQPPKPHFSQDSWTDDAELLRQDDFLLELFREEDALERLPLVDADTVQRWYREHRGGSDRLVELYTVATVLSMPTLDLVLEDDEEAMRRAAPSTSLSEEPPEADAGEASERG